MEKKVHKKLKMKKNQNQKIESKVKKNSKRSKFEGLSEEDEISNSEHLVKKTKSDFDEEIFNTKQLRTEKKKAVHAINELRDILGVTKKCDQKEKELEDFIFGCNANELEDGSHSDDSHSEEETEEVNIRKPAWEDEEDENILVEEKVKALKNCHRSISLRGSEKLSEFAQQQFKKVVGEPKWAEIERKEISDGDSGDELQQKTGNFIELSKSLPKGNIRIQKCPSLIDESLKSSIVKCVEFHPSARVAVVAATNGTASLFQIDGKINAKIQSVHFEKFPIHSAHFSLNGNELLVGSNIHGHYFSYDMLSGKIVRIPWDKGMEQKNIRRFHMSPDGKYIVIQGRYGYIHLATAKSKEWVGSLKMNGEVIAVTFNKDGSKMFSHGDTGEVYIWDMNTRKCIHKFVDEGCITGTSLALSPNEQFLATGSDSGVVNIYDSTLFESNSPKPVKVLMNLTTEATHMKFNCTSEILALASSHKQNAVKLVHFPSMSVFSNFPVREDHSKLNYINSLDISVNSGYLCLGNNLSTVHIFRLKHYHNY